MRATSKTQDHRFDFDAKALFATGRMGGPIVPRDDWILLDGEPVIQWPELLPPMKPYSK
jgi:hypothetical protein